MGFCCFGLGVGMELNNRRDNREEDIRCAAVWFDDKKEYKHQPKNIKYGYVICGLRHHNCFTNRFVLGLEKIPLAIQGFLTSKDRFVGRNCRGERI